MFDQVLAGIVGDFTHHLLLVLFVVTLVEADVVCISGGNPQGLKDQSGAGKVERAFDQSIDYVHERKLDGFMILKQCHGVEAHIDALLHAFDGAGVEVTEKLAAQGGRSASLSRDFDVGAVTNVGMRG